MEETAAGPFSELRITLLNKEKLKGLASCKVANTFCLTGLRIVEGSRGLFVAMPARKDDKGDYHDIIFPANKEVAEQLRKYVMEKYEQLQASSPAA